MRIRSCGAWFGCRGRDGQRDSCGQGGKRERRGRETPHPLPKPCRRPWSPIDGSPVKKPGYYEFRLRTKLVGGAALMRFEAFEFGSIRIDGITYERDVVVDRGEVRERRKKASKPFRDAFGHTHLSVEEKIPWKCRRLVVGTGAQAALPVMDEVKREADRRGVELLSLPTSKAIEALNRETKNTNAVLHITC